MRAMLLEEFGQTLVFQEVPDPEPLEGEVLVKVDACAADMFDIKIRDGQVPRAKLPLILGHEVAGEIVELGPDVADWSIGQRVTCSLYLPCGTCRKCMSGRETICEGNIRYLGVDTHGAFADYTVLPTNALVEIPGSIPSAQASILANAAGTAYHAFTKRMRLMPNEHVIITGAGGGVGLHAIQLARLMGALVMAVDIGKDKLSAAQELGADVVVDPTQEDFSGVALDWTGGKGVEAVLELVGNETIATSLGSLGKGGRLVIVGSHTGRDIPVHAGQLGGNEWDILGSRNVGKYELAEVVSLVEMGRLKPIVTDVRPMDQLEQVLTEINKKLIVGRVVLEP